MKRSLTIAVAIAAFVALVLPLQTYLGNAADYSYGVGRLLVEQAVETIVLSAALWALLAASERWLKGWLAPVFVALLVYFYLESGPLSFGLPELNGELPEVLGDDARRLWDSLVLAGLVASFLLAYRWIREVLHWIAVVVLALGFSSLFDVRSGESIPSAADLEKEGGLAISSEIVSSVEYSPTRNVLIFVLDTMPATIACDIVKNDPLLAAHFPGFIAYRENVGMHDCTKRGVPSLMTGRYFEPGGNTPEFMMSVLSTNSFLQAYRDRGDSIYCLLDVLSYGYTTATVGKIDVSRAREGYRPAQLLPANEVPFMCLMDVALYRMLPFVLKERFLFQKLHSRKALGNVCDKFVHEHVMYPQLAARPVSTEKRQMFGKFHTWGSHMPYCYDCDGRAVENAERDSVEVLRTAVSNCLVKVSRLMDSYREKGIYDKSFIVVTTDHGSKLTPHADGAHGQASAILWVKPDFAQEPLEISSLATSHAKIAPLMRRVSEGPLSSRSEIDGILHTPDRLFRYMDRGNLGIGYDWIFHEDGTFDAPKNGRPSR